MGIDSHLIISRLKSTSPSELVYRACHVLDILRLRWCVKKGRFPFTLPVTDAECYRNLKPPTLHGAFDTLVVSEILAGKIFSLNTHADSIRKYEETFRSSFVADIPVSIDAIDIRTVWELARLQHVTILLAATSNHANVLYREQIRKFVSSELLRWIRDNPFPDGPHYKSAMECGLRIPVFFYGLKNDDEDKNLFLNAMYAHAWWISRRLSLYSSLGNHTIAESVGLIFGGAVFRSIREGRAWLDKGLELLRQELTHQILDDGGPAEQSFNYHRFVLDLYWLAIDFLEKNNLHDCSDMKPRLLLGEEFLNALACSGGKIPAIGDSDDSHAIAPGVTPKRIKHQGNRNAIQSFPYSGYTVVRTATGGCLIFDHGPLGMAPLYNHGHADALSIIVYKDGVEMLVDPGTYRYNGEPEFRRYFKGTRAHNTVTVDGFDQAVQETGFVWRRPCRAELMRREETAGTLILEARHDGYRRLKDPVEHRRVIAFFGGAHFVIRDTFSGAGVHDFELNYHLHPDIAAKRQNDWWHVERGKAVILIRLLKGPDFTSVAGQEEPPFGWFSPAYGVKVKSDVLSCRKRGPAAETSFLTAISLSEPLSPDAYLERAGAL